MRSQKLSGCKRRRPVCEGGRQQLARAERGSTTPEPAQACTAQPKGGHVGGFDTGLDHLCSTGAGAGLEQRGEVGWCTVLALDVRRRVEVLDGKAVGGQGKGSGGEVRGQGKGSGGAARGHWKGSGGAV